MWMVRWFLFVMAIIVIAFFIMLNSQAEQNVTINYLFGQKTLSALELIFLSFTVGLITWFIISLFHFFKMRSELSGKDKIIKNLKEELNDYRNESLTLEDAEKTIIMKKESASLQPPAPGE